MSGWSAQLVILQIALPLIAGSAMLFFDERHRSIRATISIIATFVMLGLSMILLRIADSQEGAGSIATYLLGDWPAPFGIVLVLDRLSALMLVLTSVLAIAALLFALARWHRAGVYFHPLFQFLLMGLNGAFLTGDLFNLFVFFEVLLAASYGLALHGAGIARIKAGMHYVVVNLAASLLFLIGVSLIYGVTGTLNMADLAVRVPGVVAENRMLLEAGAATLGVAFLLKAGMWPLSFWLPTTYSAATPPVAAVFAIMSKVGIYILLRLTLLLFGDGAGESSGLGGAWLLYGGMATIAFGMIGVLAAQDMARMAAFTVLVSSGTLLAAIGTAQAGVTAGALFYLVTSALAIGAFFLVVELVERGREFGADMLAVTKEAYGDRDEGPEEEGEEAGIPIPGVMAVLSISFLCCTLLLVGLPPLAGFLAKFAILSGLFESTAPNGSISGPAWMFVALLILSGLATLIAMGRAGIRTLWGSEDRDVPRVTIIEIAPVAALLLLCLVLTVWAGPVLAYMEATARSLHDPAGYIARVLAAPRTVPLSAETGQ
jgi:multicomponent K+:H+ antiporter subunit D